MKYLIMRVPVFEIGDDHWVTFLDNFLTPSSPLPSSESDSKSFARPESLMPHVAPLACSAVSEMVSRTPAPS